MTILKKLLAHDPRIISVAPTATVLDAVKAMVEANVGSTIVMDGQRPVGIFTERDLMRWVILQEGGADQARIADLMTTDLVVAHPGDSVGVVILLMRKHHVRHIPVVEEDGTLLGVLSIRDLIRQEVREMREYIARTEG